MLQNILFLNSLTYGSNFVFDLCIKVLWKKKMQLLIVRKPNPDNNDDVGWWD